MGDCRMPLRGKDHKVIIERLLGGFVADVSQYSMGFRSYSSIDEPFMYVDVTNVSTARAKFSVQTHAAGTVGGNTAQLRTYVKFEKISDT